MAALQSAPINGNPIVQHGDLFGYDGMSGSLKPVRGITQNIALGNGRTLQIISGLIVGVTGP